MKERDQDGTSDQSEAHVFTNQFTDKKKKPVFVFARSKMNVTNVEEKVSSCEEKCENTRADYLKKQGICLMTRQSLGRINAED